MQIKKLRNNILKIKFHKVVRQQNSDVVEDFISPYSIPQFIYESKRERTTDIGVHLPKLS